MSCDGPGDCGGCGSVGCWQKSVVAGGITDGQPGFVASSGAYSGVAGTPPSNSAKHDFQCAWEPTGYVYGFGPYPCPGSKKRYHAISKHFEFHTTSDAPGHDSPEDIVADTTSDSTTGFGFWTVVWTYAGYNFNDADYHTASGTTVLDSFGSYVSGDDPTLFYISDINHRIDLRWAANPGGPDNTIDSIADFGGTGSHADASFTVTETSMSGNFNAFNTGFGTTTTENDSYDIEVSDQFGLAELEAACIAALNSIDIGTLAENTAVSLTVTRAGVTRSDSCINSIGSTQCPPCGLCESQLPIIVAALGANGVWSLDQQLYIYNQQCYSNGLQQWTRTISKAQWSEPVRWCIHTFPHSHEWIGPPCQGVNAGDSFQLPCPGPCTCADYVSSPGTPPCNPIAGGDCLEVGTTPGVTTRSYGDIPYGYARVRQHCVTAVSVFDTGSGCQGIEVIWPPENPDWPTCCHTSTSGAPEGNTTGGDQAVG